MHYTRHRILIKQILYYSVFYGYLFVSSTLATFIGKDLYVSFLSTQYISRWRFQSLCRFHYDPYTEFDRIQWATQQGGISFDPAHVKLGDIIFVRNVDQFFNTMAPRIRHPFIIMTHGDYRDAFMPQYQRYIQSRKVIAWFGIHPNYQHSKFFLLPLGVYQGAELHANQKQLNQLFSHLRTTTIKDRLLYVNFDAKENKPERIKLLNYFQGKPFCTLGTEKPFTEYITEMARFKFVLSPPGLQIDCYRTWEALLLGSIPIVKSSYLNLLYKRLPVLVVDKWEDITEEFLERKYTEITRHKYNLEELYIEYWIHKIKIIRRHFLRYYKRALDQPLNDPARKFLFRLAQTYRPEL